MFFFSSRRRHTRSKRDWSSDVCSSDLSLELVIESVVKPLVDYPEDIVIEEKEEAKKVVYHLTVNEADVGKVIGKNGRIGKAIRTIVCAGKEEKEKREYLDRMEANYWREK